MFCITILCTVYALFHTDVVYIGDNHLIPSKKKKKFKRCDECSSSITSVLLMF